MHEALSLPLKGLIFDCDGVLIDSRHANMTYYNTLLEAVGRPPMNAAQEEFVHMASEKQAVAHILSKEDIDRYYAIAATIPYKKTVLPLLELAPGVKETLVWLREQGLRLAVHTNRGSGMRDIIDKFSLNGLFDPVMTADIVQAKPSSEGVQRVLCAWNIPAREVIFVGDSRADAEAASGEQVPFVAFKNRQLSVAMAHIDSFAQLRELVETRIIQAS